MKEGLPSIENKDKSFHTIWLQDYANKIMKLGADFTVKCNSDPITFKTWILEHPIITPTDYVLEKNVDADKFIEFCGDKVKTINELIERINIENDEAIIKQIVNKILLVIYDNNPSRWFDEPEYSADLLK
jgi:hypothetical protein